MDEGELLARIQELVDDEHELLQRESRGELTDPGQARRRAIEQRLDQLWDLLRQRRARREFGQDPETARERPVDVVEKYEQ